jgi:hypothetical protein
MRHAGIFPGLVSLPTGRRNGDDLLSRYGCTIQPPGVSSPTEQCRISQGRRTEHKEARARARAGHRWRQTEASGPPGKAAGGRINGKPERGLTGQSSPEKILHPSENGTDGWDKNRGSRSAFSMPPPCLWHLRRLLRLSEGCFARHSIRPLR